MPKDDDEERKAVLGYRAVILGALITGACTVTAAGIRWLPDKLIDFIRPAEIATQYVALRPVVDTAFAESSAIREIAPEKYVWRESQETRVRVPIGHTSICKCIVNVRNLGEFPLHLQHVEFEIGTSSWRVYSEGGESTAPVALDSTTYTTCNVGSGERDILLIGNIDLLIPAGSNRELPLLFWSNEVRDGRILHVFGRVVLLTHDGREIDAGFVDLTIHPESARPANG